MKTLGIIDIGSNSIKSIIIQLDNNSYNEIFHRKFQVRLSNFVDKNDKTLSSFGTRNLLKILQLFKNHCHDFDCNEIIAVATESLRQIKNSKDIIDDISKSLNINIKLLSPAEECYFGYISSIPKSLDNYIHLDIGGGSVEIGLIKNKLLKESISIPIGCLKIKNKFHTEHGITSDEKYKIQEYIYNKLNKIPWINTCKSLPSVVIGGSIKTIGRIHQSKSNITSDIHGYELFYKDINHLLQVVMNLSIDEITSDMDISKNRADILIAALVVLHSITLYLQTSKIIISKYTIREGIVVDYVNKINKEEL